MELTATKLSANADIISYDEPVDTLLPHFSSESKHQVFKTKIWSSKPCFFFLLQT
jgi:hypothetical protein